jgi:hypothetical protein
VKQLRHMTLRQVNLRPFWRSVPDWFGPAAYGVTVFAIVVSALAILMTIGGSPGPHTVTQQAESKRVAARAPMDTPDTAPQLSPIYPTTPYNMPESTGQADLARKLAREGRPQALSIPEEETRETSGYAPRFVPRRFRPEPMH